MPEGLAGAAPTIDEFQFLAHQELQHGKGQCPWPAPEETVLICWVIRSWLTKDATWVAAGGMSCRDILMMMMMTVLPLQSLGRKVYFFIAARCHCRRWSSKHKLNSCPVRFSGLFFPCQVGQDGICSREVGKSKWSDSCAYFEFVKAPGAHS